MKEIELSKCRVSPSSAFDEVQKNGKPIIVTRQGQPIVMIQPPSVTGRQKKTARGTLSAR
jgi:antitoxin (DNA-binding transcriptional repressor) of toxin-antitoxin stability system